MFKFISSFCARLREFFPARKASNESAPEEYESDEFELDPDDPFPEIVQLEIRDYIDLHTIPPRDVRRVVGEYLIEARKRGFLSVRIVHGKGKGVQRKIVRDILSATPFVRAWTDAPPASGGWGATIAHLLAKDRSQEGSEESGSLQ